MKVSRRDFIRYAAMGVVAVGAGAVIERNLVPLFGRTPLRVRLAFTEAMLEMVDHTMIYHWAFEDLDNPAHLPQIPGPLINIVEGDPMEISLTNNLPDAHGFRVNGSSGEIGAGVTVAPGETKIIKFTAPAGGSYMYLDHLNAPVNRALGLHGPMIVLPKAGNAPYSDPTPAVQMLFDDLGKAAHFPGEPWNTDRTRIWMFSSVDPKFHQMAQQGQAINAATFKNTYIPRYFTINGESGAYSSHNHNTTPSGRIGQPLLIRVMNAGMNADSPHIHGNHVYVLCNITAQGNRRIEDNVKFLDTTTSWPGATMDWLLPFLRPPDIAGDESLPVRTVAAQELALTLGGVGQSPITFPMHGHNEQSQSADGGNYPQGMVTHWEITGDLDGVDFPPSNPVEKGGKNTEMMV